MTPPPRIAILGGGVSGALVASHLLRSSRNLSVTIIEPDDRVGPGLAFGRCEPYHLLNVPAGRMSALPDEPHHFLHWLERARGEAPRRALVPPNLGADSFAPRLLFGDYIEAFLNESQTASASLWHRVEDTAIRIEHAHGAFHVSLARGDSIAADIVVLALGNVAPTTAHSSCAAISSHAKYSHNIWSDFPWRNAERDETVLFIGTGLTMIDGVLAFSRAGHTGKMIGLSRRGLLPAVHRLGQSAPTFLSPAQNPCSLRETISAVRRAVRAQRDVGVTWHAVLDSLRSITPELWRGFSESERRRFLRHVKSYWETNRHRLAPELHREIESLTESGRLTVQAGNLIRVVPAEGRFTAEVRPRGSSTIHSLTIDRVVNCTGPEATLSASTSPLLHSLFEAGLISTDPLHLGLRAAPSGFVLDKKGSPSTSILSLGPLLKGMYWETTAVPEIRTQAATVARSIIETLPLHR